MALLILLFVGLKAGWHLGGWVLRCGRITAYFCLRSVIKPLITTIEQSRIVKSMGQLSAADRESLGKVIQTILGS
ncbi:hypothetical protein [Microbulbifer thermotolerans]|uniref:hypothetical protein n=1 Tax=Microbulbifer thermotolerans TaxID=252514 RepID=UPI0011141B92|nr:hypothetical protein [Microbulbifer thermotolerans]MCX2832923.1 hypothetical protein [Microbulbifer thermotolerans]